jgi:hypothetical protein
MLILSDRIIQMRVLHSVYAGLDYRPVLGLEIQVQHAEQSTGQPLSKKERRVVDEYA